MKALDGKKCVDLVSRGTLLTHTSRQPFTCRMNIAVQQLKSRTQGFAKDVFWVRTCFHLWWPVLMQMWNLIVQLWSWIRIPGVQFDSVYYPDDTILFSSALNELLLHIEEYSEHYGLKIKRSTCHPIHMYHGDYSLVVLVAQLISRRSWRRWLTAGGGSFPRWSASKT